MIQITHYTSPNYTDHPQLNVHWIHSIENIFTVQDFWATCACPEKHSVSWINCMEYIFFVIQEFWATCACPEKQSCPEIFHCIEIFFIIQDFWATCACLNTDKTLQIFKPGGCFPPTSYAYVCMYNYLGERTDTNLCEPLWSRPWAQFCCEVWGDSLVWNQHSHRVDAEVTFYI